MADTERRYGPTIDLQGFDLATNLGTNMDAVDEPSRLPLIVLVALVVLAAFGGVVWLAYTQGVERGRESVSRELGAQELWKMRKPAQPAYTGLKIYEPPGATGQSVNARAAMPARQQAANTIPPLRKMAGAAPDSLAVARTGANPAAARSGETTAGEAPMKSAAAVPTRLATRAPTELTKPAAAPPTSTHPLTEPESLAPAPAAAPPARKPIAAPAAAAVTANAASGAHAEVSGILLQIGSYKSEAEARASWQAFTSEHDAAAGYQPDVKEVDLGAKGTWYRLRMGPFPDKASALEACRKLKADGAGCLLAQ